MYVVNMDINLCMRGCYFFTWRHFVSAITSFLFPLSSSFFVFFFLFSSLPGYRSDD